MGEIPDKDIELDRVWKFLNCNKPKPQIVLQRQHPTARYCTDTHKIELRADSWAKMPNAEKKLVLLHEAIHACGTPHQPGFRTSIDTLSNALYPKLWGKDKDWNEFEGLLNEKLKKIRGGKEEFFGCVVDSVEEK